MTGITEILQGLNIIKLLDIFLPAGIPELITLIAFNSFFAFFGVFTILFTLSKERLWIDLKARVTNQGKGIIVYPDGSEKEVLIKMKQASLEEKLNEKNNLRWTIRSEGWDRQSNGVPVTIFHYDIPYNVGICELAKFYKGYKQDVMGKDEQGNLIKIAEIPYRPLIMSSREVDANIVKLANAEIATMVDPNKGLVNAAIAISLIMITGFAIVLVLMFLPSAPAAAAPVAKAIATTTTTIAHSGIAGVSGG